MRDEHSPEAAAHHGAERMRVRERVADAMSHCVGVAYHQASGQRQVAACVFGAAVIHAAEVQAAALDRLTAALERSLGE